MKRIVIELDDDFHKRVKLHALTTDGTIKKYVHRLLKESLEETKKEQTR